MADQTNNSGAIEAAKAGDVEKVASLLKSGANNYYHIACAAAEYGHIEVVRLVMNNLNRRDYRYVMCKAATANNIDIIKLTVSLGVDESELNYCMAINKFIAMYISFRFERI